MDGADLATTPSPAAAQHHSRPTLGFPLGTALLLLVIFCLSAVFSCCYHWEKLQALRHGRRRRRRGQHDQDHDNLPSPEDMEDGQLPQPSPPSPTSKLAPMHQEKKLEKSQSLPVIMPGDKIPKFMAWPCPCQPAALPATSNSSTLTIAVLTDLKASTDPLQQSSVN